MSSNVFLQPGDGHGHLLRQAPFLLILASRKGVDAHYLPRTKVSRFLAASEKVAQAITGLEVLIFEPSMLWTRYRQGREGAHEAPVENVEEQCSRKANKRQILFSPIIRYQAMLPSRRSQYPARKAVRTDKQLLFQFLDGCGLGVLSSLETDGATQSTLLGIAVTPELEIVFDTVKKSPKFANIARDPRVAFVIGWQG